VLPHFLQNLRYIQSTTDVAKLQTSLNFSLSRTLHVYRDHTAVLADTGVPPLNLIQYIHLAQSHFCLTETQPDTLAATLFETFNEALALSNLHPSTLDYHIRNSLLQLHIDPLLDPLPHMVTLPHKSRKRAYYNILGAQRRRALARRHRAPTGSDQSHEDAANRGFCTTLPY